MTNPQLFWHIARASGITSWLFGSTSVVTGLLLSSKSFTRPRPNWQLDLHRHQSTIAIAALVLHIAGLVADSYVHVGLLDIAVPLHMAWKPVAVAYGVVAMYALAVVQVSSMLRSKISKNVWKRLHLLSFGVYVLTTAHFLFAGTDRSNLAVQWGTLLMTVLIVSLTVFRIFGRPAPKTRVRPTA